MFRRNVSGQFLYFGLVSALSGNVVTGQSGGISGRRSIDGGSMTLLSGFVGEVAGGLYVANLFDFDLNGNNIGFLFTASGCAPVTFSVNTDSNVSGRIGIVSGTNVNVWSGQLSGAFVNVHSGQLSGQPISLLSGRSWTASGIFAVATAEVGSGTVFLASGSVILPSGGAVNLLSGQFVNVYSGQLSGHPVNPQSGVTRLASGTTILPSGGAVDLLSGREVLVYSGQLSGQKVDLLSGNQVQVWSGTRVNLFSGTNVNVWSGQLSGHQVDLLSGRSYTASGIFAVATAEVASGTVFLASGSVILPSGGLVGLLSGQSVLVYSGQLSGQPIRVLSGQLSGQKVDLLSGNQVGIWSGTSVNVFSGSLLSGIFDADGQIESGMSFRQSQRLITAAAAGELSGAGTSTIRIRNAVADHKTRITATVDASGNRTSITYDLN